MELAEAAKRYLNGEKTDSQVLHTLWQRADRNGADYYLLLSCLDDAKSASSFTEILKDVIKNEKWKQWVWIGNQFGAESLTDYLTKHPPNGLGTKLNIVEKLISDDPEALALFREGTTGKPGGDRQSEEAKSISDNITNGSEPKRGTSKAYTLDRLKNQRPDLFKRVVEDKLSAHAAAKLAGWIKSPEPLKEIRKWWGRASAQEREVFLREINTLRSTN